MCLRDYRTVALAFAAAAFAFSSASCSALPASALAFSAAYRALSAYSPKGPMGSKTTLGHKKRTKPNCRYCTTRFIVTMMLSPPCIVAEVF